MIKVKFVDINQTPAIIYAGTICKSGRWYIQAKTYAADGSPVLNNILIGLNEHVDPIAKIKEIHNRAYDYGLEYHYKTE